MKKILRNIFSGYFLIILILLVEIGLIVFAQLFLDDIIQKITSSSEDTRSGIIALIYIGFKLISFIIALLIFFRILNKIETPDFKTPWIVFILLMPIFCTFMYLIFGNHGLRRRDKKIISATKEAYETYINKTPNTSREYLDELESALGTIKYIHNVTGLKAHRNNKVTYYKSGEEFFPELLNSLKRAKEFIFIEFFIIADGKIWNEAKEILIDKAKEGVDVRIVYDDMGCGGTISSLTPKRLAKYGIKCFKFHPFRPILSGVYNNRDHRKIVIIDHEEAYTGGMNLADEYSNIEKRFGYWKDTMVKIEGSAISNLITVFLQNYNLCTRTVDEYSKYLDYEYPVYNEEGFVMPFGDGPGDIDGELIGEQTYINMLNCAKKTVYISTPYLIPTYELLNSIKNAALRGVDVHLIVPGIPDKKIVYSVAKTHFRFLLDAGVKIYTYTPGFNHMKTVLVDSKLCFVGTINFDYRSLVHHFECGTVLYNNPCLKDTEEDFKKMIEESKPVPQDFKLKATTRRICSLIKIFTPLM